ncbi:endonuclease/exonuclease/phosphatase family protein [Nonomuraea gerenzanensis]|uniref:Putative secreted protein n=1 Tax=Nonomuraea gerenzanensis TaxID=93944 RepID=A0A1M4EGR7_9ACTN|nr:endonuclease/exonuclease/phosphatase family protein [Nonomuraea gerenzanensis]UBU09724.1 endonuclease/exonuclease/phosphatase family protein [Nonomuraea gerenzanensis]SBO98161.1 putative secreted protein [Nonomuraea gerenzanensis]
MNGAEPYGPLIGTGVRVLTWNVWGEEGPYAERAGRIEKVVRDVAPDVVALQEWAGQRLGYEHAAVISEKAPVAVLSRWPVVRQEDRLLPGGPPPEKKGGVLPGRALFCELDGPRGPLQVFSVMIGAYRLGDSQARQEQVRALAAFVQEVSSRRHPTLVCGDFNAPPDSDEMRMLTGRAATPVPGLVFYDAWEVAGDGGPGHTWSNANPWARPGLYPDRRFDYVLSAWPRAGGAGHPVRCEVVGDGPEPGSDHYAVLAELRY